MDFLEPGDVCTVNYGPNSNSSEFMITLMNTDGILDGSHVVFGTVMSGMNVCKA